MAPRGDFTTRTISDAASSGNTLWLVISAANGMRTFPLPPKASVVFGRDAICDVVLQDETVSRRHAVIEHGWLRDLGSRNGTRSAGRLLEENERVEVSVGSVFEVGSALIVVQAGQPARAPAHGAPAEANVVVDPVMQRAYALAEVIGPSSLHVIILGETGTGKEVYAEALVRHSPRASRPFLRVNCATLQGSLLESELFGYVKGAFTGAYAAKPGLIEAAHGGTLFLDEIGELPLETQAKLLRALESGEVTRLGSVASVHVDVRYIAATHRDLAQGCRSGTFRSDLFYRLNGFSVSLPPLRRRPSEITAIARVLLHRFATRAGVSAPQLSDEAERALLRYPWPGNVRELRNVVERALVLSRGASRVGSEHILLPEPSGEAEAEASASTAEKRFEVQATLRDRDRIVAALAQAEGNQTRAAKLLGVSRRALINRIEEYGLERPRKR